MVLYWLQEILVLMSGPADQAIVIDQHFRKKEI